MLVSIDAENFSAEIDFYPSYELVKERFDALLMSKTCGAGRDRTDDIQLAKLALSQLSYSPECVAVPPPAGCRRVAQLSQRRDWWA